MRRVPNRRGVSVLTKCLCGGAVVATCAVLWSGCGDGPPRRTKKPVASRRPRSTPEAAKPAPKTSPPVVTAPKPPEEARKPVAPAPPPSTPDAAKPAFVDAIALYLPLDEGRILAHPTNARVEMRGTPRHRAGKRDQGLVFDASGRGAQGLTVEGPRLADPAHGTIGFWMNPLAAFKTGRNVLVHLSASTDHNESLHLFIEGGSLYLQSRARGKWPGAHFNFDWVGKPQWEAGRWYHVAVTFGTDQPTVFYVDGKKTFERDTHLGFDGNAAPVDRVLVGFNGSGQQAGAVLDDVVVCGAVLDAKEIASLAALEKLSFEERPTMGPGTTSHAGPLDGPLPAGVKRVWGLANAHRETTPTRERICINGLWRWQPGSESDTAAPKAGWGHFKVPGCWPGITNYMQKDCQTVHTHPSWASKSIRGVVTAWYQREITIPRDWTGRRIALSLEYLNSFATVFVDGHQVGMLRFPAGEADLTSVCRPGKTHTLSVRVTAMPLKAVMLSFNDTNSARQIKGSVARRGLCGDVFLCGTPARARIDDVKIDTSVRKWEVRLETQLAGLEPGQQYQLKAEVHDGGRVVKRLDSEKFGAADLVNDRFAFSASWKPDKLWDTHTPGNFYTVQVALHDAGNAVLDTHFPVRVGFREFWIDGRDFYLNGTRIFLSSIPLDNAQIGAAWSTYEAAKESFLRLRTVGLNYFYTHNYSCNPGTHLGFEEILRAADDVGMLVGLSQPHFGHYDWDDENAEEKNGYAEHAAFYVRVAQNHPSVVFYDTSHNSTGDSNDMDPDKMGCDYSIEGRWASNNRKKASRAEAIIRRLDPSRVVYHHSSGSFGVMHTSNFYPNFVPVQEMSDWFGHWATHGTKPVFTCEYGCPFSWDWTMYRGWYPVGPPKGKRTFGSAKVPWEFSLAEWNAQFYGDRAFRISDHEKEVLRFEARKLKAGTTQWHRWDYPGGGVGSKTIKERYEIFGLYYGENFRAFRTWGLSATSPWNLGILFRLRDGVDQNARVELETDWEDLQRPGFSPDYIASRYARMDLAYERDDWIPNDGAKALMRYNRPLMAYIAGKAGAFTSKDHNFLAGQTAEKQIIVINNSRETASCQCEWSCALPRGVRGAKSVSVKTGDQARVRVSIPLPAGTRPGAYELSATMKFSTGEEQSDSFTIHVMPSQPATRAAGRIALFDPKGQTRRLLDEMRVRFTEVKADADLSHYDILVVGKEALTVGGAGPDIGRVRDGLKVIAFEQTPEVLEQRLGFRIARYGLRRVYPRVGDHPVLAGLGAEHLRDWKGEATIVPPRLKFPRSPAQNYGFVHTWAGLPMKLLWRCGNRGNVATALIEKPACGDFLPIVDGGFSLQYSPLMEYREGAGMVVFCQLDVTGRTETDPAAERIVRNLVGYVSSWKPAPARQVVYVGESGGRTHLQKAGIAVGADASRLTGQHVLVVGPGGGRELAARSGAVASMLKAGGAVLAMSLDEGEANSILPFRVQTKKAEHISSFFEPAGMDSLLAGIGPADVHNRDPRSVPLVQGGARVVGNGVLAEANNAKVVFCQIAPWQFPYKIPQNSKRTFRRTSCTLSRILGNMGVRVETGVLDRFATPVTDTPGAKIEGVSVWYEQGDRMFPLAGRWKGMPLAKDAAAPAGWDSAAFNDDAWRSIKVPGLWEDQFEDLVDHNGLFLYRKTFELSAAAAGRDLVLSLGAIDDEDWTSVNGVAVGSITATTNPKNYWMAARRYRVPASALKAGKNVLAIKVSDLRQAGGIKGMMAPAGMGGARWLRGLYLDKPEQWDYPYRFFRW